MEIVKLPIQVVDAEFLAAKGRDDRTAEVRFYSGASVKRFTFANGEHYLKFSLKPEHVRLQRLNSGRAPLLNAHDDNRLGSVIGVVEKGWLENNQGRARVRFSQREEVEPIWQDVQDGILRNVSMGAAIHKLEDISEKNAAVKSFLATDWEPWEISVVPIGADPKAAFLAAPQETECVIESPGVKLPAQLQLTLEVGTNPRAETRKEREMDDTIVQSTGAEARENTGRQSEAPVADEQLNAARVVGATAEQGRITGILRVAKVCGLPFDFAERHIQQNTSLETFRTIAIDEQANRASQVNIRGAHADILRDEADTRRRNMAGALLERFEPGKWSWDEQRRSFRFHLEAGQRPYDGSLQYCACTLLDIAKECLAAQNIRWQNKSRTDIAQLAFQSTSDFPYILADVAGKSLRAGYEAVPAQWRLIAARRTAADFKTQKELTLDSNSRLEVVPESGEFKRGKLVEGRETYVLRTYGKIIAITRQAIINDDLGAFTRTPQLLGQEVAMLEADTVFGIITANGALADGKALFDGTYHFNVAATPAAISVDSLGAARVLMMTQTSTGDKTLGIQPRYLLAPAAKSQLAEQYTSAAYVAAQPSNINPLAGRLTPIIEARLDAASATAWYLFADPNTPNGVVLVYAYLEGQEGPYTETRSGFEVDGTEVKIRHDFAAAAVDYRGAVQNTGA